MAPIKFDDNIKNKLEKRTIQPSSDAWNKLSSAINSEEKKSSRHLFFYIGIAASIIGVLFVSTLFFKSSEDNAITPQIVDTKIEEKQNVYEETINSEIPKTNIIVSEVKDIQKKEDSKIFENKVTKVSSIKNELKTAQVSEENDATLMNKKAKVNDFKIEQTVATIDNNSSVEKEAVALNKLTLEEAKILEVVNQIKQLELDGTTATDQEIEDLLKQAEKEILRQRIYDKTTRTVDADALLQDVEEDLEHSFRTKVFETLKSSYRTVKTAVAERNN